MKNSIDPYDDGICKNISKALKKRGYKDVKSKEGEVKKSANGQGWEVRFPQGVAKVDYNLRGKEWFITKWEPTVEDSPEEE